jgi:hypothetical protein
MKPFKNVIVIKLVMLEINSLSHKYNLHKISIEDVQNIAIFTIAVSSLFSYLYYNTKLIWYTTNESSVAGADVSNVGGDIGSSSDFTYMYDMLLPVVGFHAIIDFFLTKSYDLKIHHLFIFGVIFYGQYYNVESRDRFIILYPFVNTEISSIFYVLKYWLPKNRHCIP